LRTLTPEILDFLAPDDPRAVRSRRDLVLINAMMRQSAIMAKALARTPVPKLLADLGGGDGRFMLKVARRLAKRWPQDWSGVTVMIADQRAIVSADTKAQFAQLGWRCECLTGDIFETLPRVNPDIVTANLFLHHFDEAALKQLLTLVAARAKSFVACEPRRGGLALLGARLVFVLGANDVSRHDAVASVRAGFAASELSALWPQEQIKHRTWKLREKAVFPFTHLFEAHAL
jgi:hypothetical protein